MAKRIVSPTFCYILIIGLSLWLIGFVGFCLYALSFKFQPAEHADAIVVLTGGGERIQKSLTLLKDNYANYLLISGVHPSVRLKDLTHNLAPDMKHRITLDYIAQDTRGNARQTAEWIHKNGINSILLITSFYHMPRSIFEVLKICPNLHIIPLPVFPKSFDDSVDWIRTRYAWLLFIEYHKFMATHLQDLIERIFR
ncbi:MAG: YdcF family protein [Pseudomonadota bacterium]|nr:YdcF family protein [Pseudomonadota bacterium]